MRIDIDFFEYNEIVKEILNNREFKKLEMYKHHGINRLEHSKRVSFYSYKICKKFNLDYVSAARGGLLHDFFMNTYKKYEKKTLLVSHPKLSLYNAKKHFKLNKKEVDIIRSHMFPINFKIIPKYKESLIVTLVDKVACVFERFYVCKGHIGFKLGKAFIYLFLLCN